MKKILIPFEMNTIRANMYSAKATISVVGVVDGYTSVMMVTGSNVRPSNDWVALKPLSHNRELTGSPNTHPSKW